ncbi:DUF6763 family protein [Simiduia aestuariiviva]|uniref:Uncharacterized protein n=1 Tax=Simiduia aestuariiviva TaxID=1510459 RepID=A0A839UT15_9GAMM|nr:DUF6763 family protein [Simiduia aestuariiviva]MBB3168517.1 hypothetical protein [Simiduia aestuariiviva]
MPTPHTGQWYSNRETGQYFEIVALDVNSTTIEIQYVDGSLDEIDAEMWSQLDLLTAAPPEDPTSGYETMDGDAGQCGIDGDPPNQPFDIERLEPDTFTGSED